MGEREPRQPREALMTPEDQTRLLRALSFAMDAHGHQTRKGSSIPYVSHLLQVCGLVLENGGDIDQAAAALLHDVVEDTEIALEDVKAEFGADVARMVSDCTDTGYEDTEGDKSPWFTRKRAYVDHLKEASVRSLLVSACDKRHNLGSMVLDVRNEGLAYQDRFMGRPEQQVWYYQAVLDALGGRVPTRLYRDISTQLIAFEKTLGGLATAAESEEEG